MSTTHPPIVPPIEPLAALKIHPPPITYSPTAMAPPSSTAPRKRKLAPATSTPAASSPSTASGDIEEEDAEYAPQPPTSKRSAKSKAKAPGAGRALSREALRKANHSMIERRRREKINAALGELREMVPGLGDAGGKGGEFKLEVLERTVEHMRDLNARLQDLEARLKATATPSLSQTSSLTGDDSSIEVDGPSDSIPVSVSKDSSGVEADRSDFSLGSSSHMSPPRAPSISTLLASTHANHVPQPTRPQPGPQASNPTLYLPFPTPSPTSPFLNYTASTASSASLQTSLGPDPSPFMAPLPNMSLFGGALNLDAPGDRQLPKGMGAEEAANVLLAFSSPDTLRPTSVGMTPLMTPMADGRPRRSTLDGEDFVLDGGVRSHDPRRNHQPHDMDQQRVGKTARDILRM